MNGGAPNPRHVMAMDEPTCLLCGGGLKLVLGNVTDTRFGIPDSYSIYRCRSCSLEQIWPRPTPEALQTLYEHYYNFIRESGALYTRVRLWFLGSPLYRVWLALDGDISFHGISGSGRLLDVGCNEGRGLVLYRKNGFAAEGLEVNPVAAAAARAKGFPVHEEELKDFSPDAPFDVAVLSNVLEHALDPKEMLSHVHRILREGGEVWISCPNNRSFLRAFFGWAWINWHVPFHIAHFSFPTLARLLDESGFRIRDERQANPALWVAQSVIVRASARPGVATRRLRNPFLVGGLMLLFRGFLFPVLWFANARGRGDCLILRAQRL